MRPETVNGQLFEGTIAGGTPQLFSTKEMLSDKARYPKGFTPDRLEDVRRTTGIRPQQHHASRAGAMAGVVETLAASTAPLQHMTGRGLGSVHWYAGPGTNMRGDTSNGQYVDQGGSHGAAFISEGRERTATVIHELGHHVSHFVAKTPHAAYDTTTNMGHEEAFAENYADTHFRDRRGRPNQTSRTDASGWTNDGQRGGRYGGFHEAWNAKRLESPVVQQDRARDQAISEKMLTRHPLLPKGHVNRQIPLLQGVSRGMGMDETHDWDYARDDDSPGADLKRETTTPTPTKRARELTAQHHAYLRRNGIEPKVT